MKKAAIFLILILTISSMTSQAQETKYLSMSPNVFVKDMKISQEFYTKILGFETLDQIPKDTIPVWAMLAHGEITFMLQSQESLGDEIPSLKAEKRGGTLIFYIKLTNIKAYFEKVSKKAKVIKGLEETFYGAIEFTVEDPDGYLLTFAEFPEETKE